MSNNELIHQIIEDIKSVFLENGHISRDLYIKQGKFGRRKIIQVFGSWTQAMQAAGIETYKNSWIAKQHKQHELQQSIKDGFKTDLSQFIGKYEKPLSAKIITIAVLADTHGEWLDKWCFDVFLDTIKRLQPNIIVLAGDIWDAYQISIFSKNPERAYSMQSEINFIKTQVFEKIRNICPDAQIDWILGNHERRLFKYLCVEARGLASLDSLKFPNLFELDKYKINLVALPNFITGKERVDKQNYKRYGEKFIITHGHATGKFTANKEFDKYGTCGVSAHNHKHQVFSKRNAIGYRRWDSLGCMCLKESGEEFIEDLISWTRGFDIIHLYKDKVFFDYAELEESFTCIGGKYYFRNEA